MIDRAEAKIWSATLCHWSLWVVAAISTVVFVFASLQPTFFQANLVNISIGVATLAGALIVLAIPAAVAIGSEGNAALTRKEPVLSQAEQEVADLEHSPPSANTPEMEEAYESRRDAIGASRQVLTRILRAGDRVVRAAGYAVLAAIGASTAIITGDLHVGCCEPRLAVGLVPLSVACGFLFASTVFFVLPMVLLLWRNHLDAALRMCDDVDKRDSDIRAKTDANSIGKREPPSNG